MQSGKEIAELATPEGVGQLGALVPRTPSPPRGGVDRERIERAAAIHGVEWAVDALLITQGCESSFQIRPCALGAQGELGPFQFKLSTWAETPYAHLDPCDVWAATLAAAWMVKEGRQYEFSCWPR